MSNQKVKNIKSSVVIDGNPKVPQPSQLDYGQIGINYAKSHEIIIIKNSNDEITTFSDDLQTQGKINQAVQGLSGALITQIEAIHGLPQVTSSDENKILKVVNGQWSLVAPINVYMTYDTPSDTYGNNGDLCVLLETQGGEPEP